MEVVNHPYLEGVKCRDDGAVFIPASGVHKGHWTFGSQCSNLKGYRQVQVQGHRYGVHRLICEAFHGPCPPGKCHVDHIDRNPGNSVPKNLRWVSRSENQRNRKVCDEVLAKYGASPVDDRNSYQRAYYASNPEYRDQCKERRRAKKKAETAQK